MKNGDKYILKTDLAGVSWYFNSQPTTIKAGQIVTIYSVYDKNRVALSLVDENGNPFKIELPSAFPQLADITYRDADDRFIVNIEEFKKAIGEVLDQAGLNGDWSK